MDLTGAAPAAAIVVPISGTHDHRVMTSSKNPNWRTPEKMREALFQEFPLVIDLAADETNTVCDRWLGPYSLLGTDALAFDNWAEFIDQYCYGFLNPPYARKFEGRSWPIEPWIERCWQTAEEGRSIVAVLPASIQTDWWRDLVWNGADEIRFLPHRVSFDPPPDVTESQNANVNTAIVIWRPRRPFIGPWTPHVRYWSYR
jgi:phage N-6-adenine-methyltransferase